ncbi:hypothetical protein HX063_08100 [Myroides odoratimimus]|uniref:S41 family peptidase n=1 Tax=Myroides odoratimimus TaxID=76832 RepID=UPI00257859A6|nr:S41 family peptidase [Myroides odoratimimus]MDM1495370.1 hypothetical protein [Myroides odoratimimus]
MKKFFALFTLLICTVSFAQQRELKEVSSESLIHVWGLVKYKHPNVSRGGYDMDQEFLKAYTTLETIKNEEALNTFLKQWIKQFDSSKHPLKKDGIKVSEDKLFTVNARFEWIDSDLYDKELKSILTDLKDNTNYGKYYLTNRKKSSIVKFDNEEALADFSNENESHRMLFLSSFWNSIRYGNVNIYLADTPWDEVLTEFVPRFKTKEGVEFEYLKDELFVKLNDSHSDYQASYYLNTKVKRFSTYGTKNINDSLVITTIYDPIEAKESNIELGDVIFRVEGKSVKDYRESTIGKYVSVSNPNYLKRFESFYFPALGDQESMTVSIKKKSGEIIERSVPLLKGEEFKNFKTVESLFKEQKAPELGDDIGYLHLGRATKKKLKNFFKANNSKQNIILDLRDYPKNISPELITSYLLPHRTTFFKALGWYGPALGEWDIKKGIAKIIDPFKAGNENKDYYKGTVVLLVDHTTLSAAEYMGMGIQQAPRCITVGKQTGGAVTNRVRVLLKDDTTIDFSGYGAFYPNDKEYNVHRNGLKIDYIIPESANNYNAYGMIQYAVDLINEKGLSK